MHLPHQDLGIAYRGDADRANIGESQGVPSVSSPTASTVIAPRGRRDGRTAQRELDAVADGDARRMQRGVLLGDGDRRLVAMLRHTGATVTSPPLSSSLPISRC